MSNLQVVERENQRVLTTKQIAEQYGTQSKVISNNFNRNKARYTQGKHFYCVEGEQLKEFKLTNPQIDESLNRVNKLYLWTEKGALLHAKSLNTDKAWGAYEYLIDFYFRAKEQPQGNQSCTPTQKLYKGQPVAIIQDISRITGFSKGAIRHVINKNCSVFDYKVLKGTELLHFKSENHLQKRLHSLIIIFESGVKKLAKIYEFKPDMLFTASNYKIIPKTFEGEPVLFYEDIMALTGLSCRQIDEYVLTEARKAPLDGICMLTVYGLPKFKQENPHLKKYLEKEKLVSFIKKKGAINLLKGCGCSKRDVKKVMDYYNQNVSIETNTIYNLDYQKLFVQLDTSNRNKVLNTMIQLYDEQMENENKVKSFSKKQNKNMLLSTQ